MDGKIFKMKTTDTSTNSDYRSQYSDTILGSDISLKINNKNNSKDEYCQSTKNKKENEMLENTKYHQKWKHKENKKLPKWAKK